MIDAWYVNDATTALVYDLTIAALALKHFPQALLVGSAGLAQGLGDVAAGLSSTVEIALSFFVTDALAPVRQGTVKVSSHGIDDA